MSMEPSSEVPERPLDPAPVQATWGRWLAISIGVNVLGLLWLAVGSGSAGAVREVVDTCVEIAVGGAAAYGSFRLLLIFPYRILDLLTIVVVLALGTKATLDALTTLSTAALLFTDMQNISQHIGMTVQICLFVDSLLLAGAALGLRYCHRLKFESPGKRMWAILCGMSTLPGTSGVISFPLLALTELHEARPEARTEIPFYMAMWGLCIFVTFGNILLFLRSLAMQAEVKR